MIDLESLINILHSTFRNIHNLDITLTKGTSNINNIIIMLSDPIKNVTLTSKF